MGLVGVLIIVGVVMVVAVIVAFVIRMRRGDEMVAGGSYGAQLGHEDTSWGPTSTPSGHARNNSEP